MSYPGSEVDLRQEGPPQRAPLWDRWPRLSPGDPRRGQWLAEVRRGAGKGPGTVPRMWPHYRAFDVDRQSGTSVELASEHICLVLFGFHQQSVDIPMNVHGRSIAEALRILRRSGRFQERESALDSKVYAAATSTSMDELQLHLRSLTSLLRTEDIAFDYSELFSDLVDWQRPGGPDRVRQRWGRDYYWRQSETERTVKASSTRTKGQSS